MKLTKFLALLLVGAGLFHSGESKAEWNDSIRYRAEIGTTLSAGEHTPLWLNANRYGFSSLERNNLWVRAGLFKDLDRDKKFSWGAGVDMGAAYRFQSIFMPQQLYAEVKYRCLDAMVGAKEIRNQWLNQDLSSGALTQGWNARPLPQIRIGVFDYADFWGCKGWFAMRGYVAYGMFTDDWWLKRWMKDYPEARYSLGTLYCSREIAFRGGNSKKFPLTGEFGIVMDTQFGGKTWLPDRKNPTTGMWEKHPDYFKAWIKAMIPMKGGEDTWAGEQLNVEGNFLGNWNFALKWEDPSGWMARVYYQHFFEDHSMLFFDYPWKDGLYGVEGRLPKNPFVSEVLYEFLYMKDQTDAVYWDHVPAIDYQVSGRDEYYNHYIYNCWQNWGQTLGNPLMTSPIYNDPHSMYMKSTRVISHHFGFKGSPSPQVDYRVLLSHTRSWGTYLQPFEHTKDNFSWLAEVKYHPGKLKGLEASVSLAGDHGHLLGNSFGTMLTISYSGFFK